MIQQIHITKTGGTALYRALKLDTGGLVRGLAKQGHAFRLSMLEDGDQGIVIVRDPVARFISAYDYDHGPSRPLHAEYPTAEAMALDMERAIRLPTNHYLWEPQSWWLDGDLSRLAWVGHTETLEQDYERLRQMLDLRKPLIAANPSSHASVGTLSDRAIATLREWYADDYRLLERLDAQCDRVHRPAGP